MPFYVLNAVYNSAFKTIMCFLSAAQERFGKFISETFSALEPPISASSWRARPPLWPAAPPKPPTQQRPQGQQEQKTNQTGKHAVARVHDRACLHCFHRAKTTFIFEMYLYKVFGNHVKPHFLHHSFIVVQYWLVLRPLFETGSRGAKQYVKKIITKGV